MKKTTALAVAITIALPAPAALAQEKVLNLYSARHYQTDESLYSNFTRKTGIAIKRLEAGDEALLERLRNEGKNSPADVILLVDAARLWKAQIEGLFQPVKSSVLESRIPDHLRARDDGKGSEWFSFSTRARIIVRNKASVPASEVASYEDLAKPSLKGKVCTRTGTHPYMLSLIGAMSEHLGEAKAQEWARGVVANFARSPRGGDTDQIKAVADKVAAVMPNQTTWGTHVNVSGGAVARHAPHRDAAVKFLEYLASDEAQIYLADGNNEWPVVKTAATNNPALEALGKFKADTLAISSIGRSQVTAAKIIDRVGWR